MGERKRELSSRKSLAEFKAKKAAEEIRQLSGKAKARAEAKSKAEAEAEAEFADSWLGPSDLLLAKNGMLKGKKLAQAEADAQSKAENERRSMEATFIKLRDEAEARGEKEMAGRISYGVLHVTLFEEPFRATFLFKSEKLQWVRLDLLANKVRPSGEAEALRDRIVEASRRRYGLMASFRFVGAEGDRYRPMERKWLVGKSVIVLNEIVISQHLLVSVTYSADTLSDVVQL